MFTRMIPRAVFAAVQVHPEEIFMIKHTPLSLMTVALLGMAHPGYADAPPPAKPTAEEVRQKLAESADAVKSYSVDKRDEAARKAKAALDVLDARIVALEEEVDRNWEKMDKAARERARGTLRALREQRVKVAEWYGALKNSSAGTWEEMKKGFSDAYKSLQHGWEKAERELRSKEKK